MLYLLSRSSQWVKEQIKWKCRYLPFKTTILLYFYFMWVLIENWETPVEEGLVRQPWIHGVRQFRDSPFLRLMQSWHPGKGHAIPVEDDFFSKYCPDRKIVDAITKDFKASLSALRASLTIRCPKPQCPQPQGPKKYISQKYKGVNLLIRCGF